MHVRSLFSLLAAATLTLGAALPATADDGGVLGLPIAGVTMPQDTPWGMLHLSAGAQSNPKFGMPYQLNFTAYLPTGYLATSLQTTPTSFMDYFVAEIEAGFMGHTGMFLPLLDLQPYMGMGGMMAFVQPNASGSISSLKIGLPIYVPIGVRYALPIGPLSLGVDVSYRYHLADYIGGRIDSSRMRYEAAVKFSSFYVGAFQDQGPVFQGTGMKAGFGF